MSLQPAERRDFIRDMISDDLASGKHQAPVTRFPRNPMGIFISDMPNQSASTSASPRNFRVRAAICVLTTPTPARKTRNMWTAFRKTSAGWALTGAITFLCQQHVRLLLRMRRFPHPQGIGLRRRTNGGGNTRPAGQRERARTGITLPQPLRGRKPGTLPGHEKRRNPGRQSHPASQDRHGLQQHEHAGPRVVPHHVRGTPQHGQFLVHLPHV